MKKFLSIIVIAIFSLGNLISAEEFQVSEPGTLSELAKDAKNAVSIAVSGTIDVRDIAFIADSLADLTTLDLSKAKIVAHNDGTAYFGSNSNYQADELPEMCFFNKEYTSVQLPTDLVAIGNGAFAGCKQLANIDLKGVKRVGDFSFFDCDALTSISFTDATALGMYVCGECDNLQEITIASEGCNVPDFAFYNCAELSKVTLTTPEIIGVSSFRGCKSLTSIDIPKSIKVIKEDAFKGAQISSLNLRDCSQLTTIGNWAFADNDALVSADLSAEKLSEIGVGTFFDDNSLSEINMPTELGEIADFSLSGATVAAENVIPEGVTRIGKYAFADWVSMSKFSLPESVDSIDDGAFRGVVNLTEMTVHTQSVPALGEKVWEEVDQPAAMLKVNETLVADFKAAEQWKEFNIQNMLSADAPEIASHVKAFFRDAVIVAEASELIASLSVYDIDGRLLAACTPNAETITIDTVDFSGNIYILDVTIVSGARYTFKLMR